MTWHTLWATTPFFFQFWNIPCMFLFACECLILAMNISFLFLSVISWITVGAVSIHPDFHFPGHNLWLLRLWRYPSSTRPAESCAMSKVCPFWLDMLGTPHQGGSWFFIYSVTARGGRNVASHLSGGLCMPEDPRSGVIRGNSQLVYGDGLH